MYMISMPITVPGYLKNVFKKHDTSSLVSIKSVISSVSCSKTNLGQELNEHITASQKYEFGNNFA